MNAGELVLAYVNHVVVWLVLLGLLGVIGGLFRILPPSRGIPRMLAAPPRRRLRAVGSAKRRGGRCP
jgi:hypothetical protein